MIIDQDRCIGCDACTVACKTENSSPGDIFWAPVVRREVGTYPKSKLMFLPTLCMHCDDPPCMKSCPSKAISKRPDGIVLIDEDKCCGSKACVSACPYNAINTWDGDKLLFSDTPSPFDAIAQKKHRFGASQKCTFCSHKMDLAKAKGIKPGSTREVTPACVLACPTGCRIFGDVEDPESAPSKYIREIEKSGKKIFILRPEAKSRPSVAYVSLLPAIQTVKH